MVVESYIRDEVEVRLRGKAAEREGGLLRGKGNRLERKRKRRKDNLKVWI